MQGDYLKGTSALWKLQVSHPGAEAADIIVSVGDAITNAKEASLCVAHGSGAAAADVSGAKAAEMSGAATADSGASAAISRVMELITPGSSSAGTRPVGFAEAPSTTTCNGMVARILRYMTTTCGPKNDREQESVN